MRPYVGLFKKEISSTNLHSALEASPMYTTISITLQAQVAIEQLLQKRSHSFTGS